MDHKIISWILKLRLHTFQKHWRILLSIIWVIWIVIAIIVPGVFVIIPVLLMIFTWTKPDKKNIIKIVKHRRRITFYIKNFLGLYSRCKMHLKRRYKKKR
jgi:hypothetical protein